MMPRKPSPDGKRNTVCAKVTDDDLALIDARCATPGLTRSAWLQSLIAAALADVTESGEVAGMRLRIDPQMPAGTAAVISPGAGPPALIDTRPPVAASSRKPRRTAPSDSGPCKHAHAIKGWCRECRTGGL
jgi:hypothetical protein